MSSKKKKNQNGNLDLGVGSSRIQKCSSGSLDLRYFVIIILSSCSCTDKHISAVFLVVFSHDLMWLSETLTPLIGHHPPLCPLKALKVWREVATACAACTWCLDTPPDVRSRSGWTRARAGKNNLRLSLGNNLWAWPGWGSSPPPSPSTCTLRCDPVPKPGGETRTRRRTEGCWWIFHEAKT